VNVLGIHWTTHDNAAALAVDGRIVAAVEEERLSRMKHGPWLYPRRSIEACLSLAGLAPRDLDAVAIDFAPTAQFGALLGEAASGRAWKSVASDVIRRGWLMLAPFVVRRHLDSPVKARYVPHHRAHAIASLYPFDLEHAAVLVVDGIGDFACISIFEARRGRRLIQRWINRFPHSLGIFYAALTEYLGFRAFGDEYKVMGLAARGRDRYREAFRALLPIDERRGIELSTLHFTFRSDYSLYPFFGPELERLLGPRRPPEEPLDERHADVAASLQVRLSEAMLFLARKAKRLTGAGTLCLSGGVALNCATNGYLRREGPFDEVLASPFPHDGGCALGAALSVAGEQSHPDTFSPYLGPSWPEHRIARAVETADMPSTVVSEPARLAAKLVARGEIVGWFQGRMEFGPRALGNRSILADPRNSEMPALLNRKVKQREEFRPFAPAVIEDRAGEIFELSGVSPFMQFAVPVRPGARARIPAVTHIDGTARVQTVSRKQNPLFRELLEEFDRLTGVPCVLNTSLNSHSEPIACTPEDALGCFGRTGLTYLILGDRLVAKTEHTLASALSGEASPPTR
jgi:carbamoyltransferase